MVGVYPKPTAPRRKWWVERSQLPLLCRFLCLKARLQGYNSRGWHVSPIPPTSLRVDLEEVDASNEPAAGNGTHPLTAKWPPPLCKADIFLSHCHSPSTPPHLHLMRMGHSVDSDKNKLIKAEISKTQLITWFILAKPQSYLHMPRNILSVQVSLSGRHCTKKGRIYVIK